MPEVLNGAPGFRFWKDIYPSARQGGLSYYPYSSIYSGFTPTITLATGAPVAAPADITAGIAAGSAILDSQVANLAAGVSIVINPDRDGAVTNGENYYKIFLNPTRRLQVTAGSAPTTLLNGDVISEGDMYAVGSISDEYSIAEKFFKYSGGSWNAFDPAFAAPDAGAQGGKGRIWGATTASKVALANFTVNQVEKKVYVGGSGEPHKYRASMALLFDSASLEVATALLYYYVLPMAVEATFTNGSTSVVVSAADRAKVAGVTSSVTATTALAIDGAALAANAYNSGTGTLTLGAAYTGTTGTKTVNITPVTTGNNVILSVARSSIMPSINTVNP